ncbi:uncharacterized protein EAE97_005801 [Botrytis byssoidea]|uniref:Heterokaryon incompatibility domain-containing protein n=1 Tax=Botrytis byssoidea TaxID=139641 RepID=A0A9P5ILS5_9HELO|nr:uncharacterized protein EAE97_005801 [Botrytis byssoidea]KAF7943731.1 hypothetical protein EAE97_005801 [Botrytis byssoidea]
MSISSTSGSPQLHLSPCEDELPSLSPTCSRCQEFLDSYDFKDLGWGDIKEFQALPPFEDPKLPTPRAVKNCFLCSKFLGSYLAEPASQAKRDSPSRELQILGVYLQKQLAGLENFVSVASSTGSDGSLNLSKQWLQNCNTSHVSCSRKATTYQNFLPTRLIDIGIGESVITPRLRLRKEIPLNSIYFTLSHCWGNTIPEIILLQSNI